MIILDEEFSGTKLEKLSLETTSSCETTNMLSCQVISRQLQKFDWRRIWIFSKIDVLHVFKEPMVEVSLLHRSFQSNKQAPCTHPLLSLSHWNVNVSGLRQLQKIQKINVIIEWLYSWIACFLDTYRNTWCHEFQDTFFFFKPY